jgi:hypothetical protein
VRTRRPRLLPAALLASALVIGTAVTALAATGSPAGAQLTVVNCDNGREWVSVRPASAGTLGLAGQWRSTTATPAGAAAVTGCVDLSQLPPETDSRG